MDEFELQSIVEKYSDGRTLIEFTTINEPNSSESPQMLQGRLQRAAINQVSDGASTLSRYQIWAETLRGIVVRASRSESCCSELRTELVQAANSLACFCEIQSRLDRID